MAPNPSPSETAIRPAATIVLTRTGTAGLQVFMVKRTRKAVFMGAFHVFPGGRIDAADRALAATMPAEVQAQAQARLDGATDALTATAFCIGAIRETAEECGVLLARHPDGRLARPAVATAVFEALREGASFAEELAHRALTPDLPALAFFGWWVTPPAEVRRYDTRFFLAEAPPDQQAGFDAVETTEGVWVTPADALARHAAGTWALAPPTMATLELLRDAQRPAAALAALPRPVPAIRPHFCKDEAGARLLALPGDPLFPEPQPPALPHRTRFEVFKGGRFA